MRPRPSGEAGETLLEISIAMIILALASTSVLGAVQTSLSLTRTHRQQVVTGRLVDNLVEYMKDETTAPYRPCPNALSDYAADLAAFTTLVGTTTTSPVYEPAVAQFTFSVDVAAPLPTPAAGDSVTFSAGSCAGTEQGLQQLTLTVQHVGGPSATTVKVTKWKR